MVIRVLIISFLVLAASTVAPAVCFGQRAAVAQAYQLTHSIVYDPSPSPDGKRLVYNIVVAGREQLFVMNVDGSNSVPLTHDEADHEDPAWSPDGKLIAFTYIKDKLERISTIKADGTGLKHLTPPEVRTIHPSWSPDGSKLAYCTDDDLAPPRKNDSDLMVVDIKTGSISTLISGGVNTYPVFSPDGKYLAFRRMIGETNSEVFVANADGSGARNIPRLTAGRRGRPTVSGLRSLRTEIPVTRSSLWIRMAVTSGFWLILRAAGPLQNGAATASTYSFRSAEMLISVSTVRSSRRGPTAF